MGLAGATTICCSSELSCYDVAARLGLHGVYMMGWILDSVRSPLNECMTSLHNIAGHVEMYYQCQALG